MNHKFKVGNICKYYDPILDQSYIIRLVAPINSHKSHKLWFIEPISLDSGSFMTYVSEKNLIYSPELTLEYKCLK